MNSFIFESGNQFLSYLVGVGIINGKISRFGEIRGVLNEELVGIPKLYYVTISTERRDLFKIWYAPKCFVEKVGQDWETSAPYKYIKVNIKNALTTI